MSLPIGEILGILSDNLERRNAVLPLSVKERTVWARGLGIPYAGETVIYTGQMYQLIPFIDAMASAMERFEDSGITRFFGAGRALNKAVNLSRVMAYFRPPLLWPYNKLLRNIARLLRAAGVDFGYLYGEELYSGALLYDLGVDGAFEIQARRVNALLRKKGAALVITVDPHTTHMLRSVYRNIIGGYEIEVKSYLEVLAERDPACLNKLDLDLVIHDSCIYARCEKVIDQPRRLLTNAGVVLHEPELSGRLTLCCGGPLESLFPGKAREIAGTRVKQLAGCGNTVVAMCPICLANLRRAAGPDFHVMDISEYLVAAYCREG